MLTVREILLRTFLNKPYNLSSLQNETTLVDRPCHLHSVTININGSADSLVILRDGTAGTVIATIDGDPTGKSFIFDIEVLTRLTVQITGTTSPDITIAVGG